MDTIDVIYEGNLISYAITETTTRRKIDVNDKISVDIDVLVDGYLQGYIIDDRNTVEHNETVLSMEKRIEEEIMKAVDRTVDHLKEVKADLLGVGEHLSKFHPREWEKIEDNWGEVFGEVEIDIDVDVRIRRIGLTN